MTTKWHVLFAALAIFAGGILFNLGCDVEQPADDDDVSDDDDTTETFESAMIETSLPSEITGDIDIVNSVLLATCEDTDTCSAETEHAAGHTIEVNSDVAYFETKVFEVTADDDGQTLDYSYDEDGSDWTMTPTGTYAVYDKPCDDPTGQPTGETKEVSVDTSAVPYLLYMNGEHNGREIANDTFTDHEYVNGTVKRDNSSIDYTDGWGSRCLRPVD